MELKQLRCFVTLAEIGNIRRAASLLATSQPALSVRIRRLEEHLGYSLFDRQARGVQLTERGKRLLHHARQLLAQASETEEVARLIGRGAFDRLEIGVTPIAALSFIPAALRLFAAAHPDVALAMTEGLSNGLEEAVAHRRLDLAVMHPPTSRDDLVVHEVFRDRYVAALPAAHPSAGAESISAAELGCDTLLSVRRDYGPATFDRIVGYFTRNGVAVKVSQCATTSISLLGLVASGAGPAVVVDSLRCIARPDLRFVPLAGEAPYLSYALCHRPDLPSGLRDDFLHALAAAAKEPAPPAGG